MVAHPPLMGLGKGAIVLQLLLIGLFSTAGLRQRLCACGGKIFTIEAAGLGALRRRGRAVRMPALAGVVCDAAAAIFMNAIRRLTLGLDARHGQYSVRSVKT